MQKRNDTEILFVDYK